MKSTQSVHHSQSQRGHQAEQQRLPRVCLILGDLVFRSELEKQLAGSRLYVEAFDSCQVFMSQASVESVQCLVLSATLSDQGDGVRFLELLHQGPVRVPTIVIAPDHEIKTAVQAMKANAIECFEQGTPLPILVKAIRALALSKNPCS